MAVYTVLEVSLNALKVPPVTLISSTIKSVVASLDVKVRVSVVSPVAAPLLTAFVPFVAVIIMVGGVVSKAVVKDVGLVQSDSFIPSMDFMRQ